MILKDKETLEWLMLEYGDYLKITAFHMLHDHQLAEDMVQETFISFYEKKQFLGKASVKTYLYKILINHVRMYMRKKKPVLTEEIVYTSDQMIFVEEHLINKMDLSYGLKSLKEKYRKPLILFYYNDMTIEEISEILSCSISGIKMRLKRGREQLKERLDNYEKNIS